MNTNRMLLRTAVAIVGLLLVGTAGAGPIYGLSWVDSHPGSEMPDSRRTFDISTFEQPAWDGSFVVVSGLPDPRGNEAAPILYFESSQPGWLTMEGRAARPDDYPTATKKPRNASDVASPVPEPATLTLLGAALVSSAFALRGRRRRGGSTIKV